MEKVAVLGGGNGGHAIAADLTLKGFQVHLYEDEAFQSKMQPVFDKKEILMKGVCGDAAVKITKVTTDIKETIQGIPYIIIAVPAFAHKIYAKKIIDYLEPGQTILLTPGTFGSMIFWDYIKKKGLEKEITLAETHTLPYAARLTAPGECLIMNRFNPLITGVMPAVRTKDTIQRLSQFFDGLQPSENVMACGLSSLNPIIHVPGCILNAGRIEYAKGDFYFYTEGFTSCVVRATLAVDEERIAILKELGYHWEIAAHGVGSGEITDDLQEAVSNNSSFAQIKGPGDTKNRYYAEDIPFGLALWAKLAKNIGVPTPVMDSMVTLGSIILEKNCWTAGHSLADLGIQGMDAKAIDAYVTNG